MTDRDEVIDKQHSQQWQPDKYLTSNFAAYYVPYKSKKYQQNT